MDACVEACVEACVWTRVYAWCRDMCVEMCVDFEDTDVLEQHLQAGLLILYVAKCISGMYVA